VLDLAFRAYLSSKYDDKYTQNGHRQTKIDDVPYRFDRYIRSMDALPLR